MPLPSRRSGATGRPRQYHRRCKIWLDHWRAAQRAFDEILAVDGFRADRAGMWRTELFQLANSLPPKFDPSQPRDDGGRFTRPEPSAAEDPLCAQPS